MTKKLLALVAIIFPLLAHSFESTAKYAIIVDHQSGKVLYDKGGDVPVIPSSMAKLMTVYILFEELASGRVNLTDTFMVSHKSWRTGGTKMFLMVDTPVKVEDLVRGAIVQSGNDACITIAENIAGTEELFASRMNDTAKRLGLHDSQFENATGIPQGNQRMSLHDIARLSSRLIEDFPQYYEYFKEREFSYNNITQSNRLSILGKLGIDGLKTGHSEDGGAGYGVAISGVYQGRRSVAVVNGLPTDAARRKAAEQIMNYAHVAFTSIDIARKNKPILAVKTWQGTKSELELTVAKDINFVFAKVKSNQEPKVYAKLVEPQPVPVSAGDEVGHLVIEMEGEATEVYPLIAMDNIERLGLVQRWFYNLITNITSVFK